MAQDMVARVAGAITPLIEGDSEIYWASEYGRPMPKESALKIATKAIEATGVEDLRSTILDLLKAMEYWAGCDEGCSPDTASSEIMSSGGAWPALAYDNALTQLAKGSQ